MTDSYPLRLEGKTWWVNLRDGHKSPRYEFQRADLSASSFSFSVRTNEGTFAGDLRREGNHFRGPFTCTGVGAVGGPGEVSECIIRTDCEPYTLEGVWKQASGTFRWYAKLDAAD